VVVVVLDKGEKVRKIRLRGKMCVQGRTSVLERVACKGTSRSLIQAGETG